MKCSSNVQELRADFPWRKILIVTNTSSILSLEQLTENIVQSLDAAHSGCCRRVSSRKRGHMFFDPMSSMVEKKREGAEEPSAEEKRSSHPILTRGDAYPAVRIHCRPAVWLDLLSYQLRGTSVFVGKNNRLLFQVSLLYWSWPWEKQRKAISLAAYQRMRGGSERKQCDSICRKRETRGNQWQIGVPISVPRAQ